MGRTSSSVTIPEAQGLTWNDEFFENDSDVVAVFDFDYEAVKKFETDAAIASFFASFLMPPVPVIVPVIMVLCCWPCFFTQQIPWDTYSKHVAVTQDGIKFVQDKRKSQCGFDFQDQGKTSKTIPFDKVRRILFD